MTLIFFEFGVRCRCEARRCMQGNPKAFHRKFPKLEQDFARRTQLIRNGPRNLTTTTKSIDLDRIWFTAHALNTPSSKNPSKGINAKAGPTSVSNMKGCDLLTFNPLLSSHLKSSFSTQWWPKKLLGSTSKNNSRTASDQ